MIKYIIPNLKGNAKREYQNQHIKQIVYIAVECRFKKTNLSFVAKPNQCNFYSFILIIDNLIVCMAYLNVNEQNSLSSWLGLNSGHCQGSKSFIFERAVGVLIQSIALWTGSTYTSCRIELKTCITISWLEIKLVNRK